MEKDSLLLKVNNIDVAYKKVIQVLRAVYLEVRKGQIVALLGPNGAGKTTVLRAISGLLKNEDGEITRGTVEFDGVVVNGYPAEKIAAMGISQVLEGRRVLEHLTVEENLMVGAYRRKDKAGIREDLERIYRWFPRLKDLKNRTSGYLSGGEQQMLVIGRALMARPKLMLLDEPSLGLAPLLVAEIYEIIKKINEETRMSMLLVEQNARKALEVAHYGYVMENGRIVLQGPAQELRESELVKDFYLGMGERGAERRIRKGEVPWLL